MAKKSKSMLGFLKMEEDAEKGAAALKELLLSPDHHTGSVVRKDELPEDYLWPLVVKSVLKEIVDGWYYVSDGDPFDLDRPQYWSMAYWDFIAAYLESLYGENWCLGADDSLLFHASNTKVPRSLTVRAAGQATHFVRLPAGGELLVVGASVPAGAEPERRFGVRLYPLEHALLAASPGFYLMHPMEARTCLSLVRDEDEVAAVAAREVLAGGAARVTGGLISIGYPILAENILQNLDCMKLRVEPENPFREDVTVAPKDDSAIATRIRLMWSRMNDDVLDAESISFIHFTPRTPSEVKETMDRTRLEDASTTLTLDGFKVTKDLARGAAEGSWDYDVLSREAGEENVAAATGYIDAYRLVQTDILDSLTGGADPRNMLERFPKWHRTLMKPFRDHQLLEEDACTLFRRKELFIKDSDYIPVGPDEIPSAMMALGRLLPTERNPFIRAVLGAFFLDYIRPVERMSGVLARLYMNSQLISYGFPWIVIPEERHDDYRRALEEGFVDLKLDSFADLINELVEKAGGLKVVSQ